jgi:hypothetical protein
MALVNPQIAMSYRPTTEYQPRNALAEYAQLQQIVGGQRQAEVADMQLESLRRKDRAISQIQAVAAKNGGPTDRRQIARAYMQSGVPEFMQFGLTLEKDLDELDTFQRIMGGGAPAAPASAPGAILGGGAPAAPAPAPAAAAAPAAPAPAPAVPRSGMAKEIFEEYGENAAKFFEANGYLPAGMFTRLADQQQGRGISREEYATSRNQFRDAARAQGVNVDAPEFNIQPPAQSDMAGQFRRDMEALGIRMAPAAAPAAAPAGTANVLAAQQGATPPENVNRIAAAGAAAAGAAVDPTAALRAKRDQLIALGTPRALQAAKSLDADIALMAKRITASPGSVVYDSSGRVIATVPAAPTAPRIDVIGVVKNTDTPVYFDKDTRQQFTIGVDASGKQVQVPYTGAVNRSTSTVTAPVDVRVNAFVPASETAQAEYMKGARTTFEALRNAQPTLDNIEKAKALVPGAQGFMGTGGEPLLAAASFLNNRLGTSINTTGVTDAQELRSRLFFGILDNLKKLDSQPSQQQQNALQQALGSIGTDPTALPRVLDAFADSIRTKVELYNQDVTSAEQRGVKFPYKPQIELKPSRAPAGQIPAGAPAQAIPQAAIDALKAGRGTDAQFDAIFGAGAAKRVRGQ